MRKLAYVLAIAGLMAPGLAPADPGAAIQCPPYSVSDTNLLLNPSFERPGPNGPQASWSAGDPLPAPSAAAGWYMHSSNAGAPVRSELVTTHVPGPNGAKMLRFIAGGNEGGVYQIIDPSPAKVMYSVWVFTVSGRTEIQATALSNGPVAWSTKQGEWEQLRVCTDGTAGVTPGWFLIYNQDPNGGEFYVDRAEVRRFGGR